MNLYLAGPMRGRPDLNRAAFAAAAARLRAQGHKVFNPGEQPDTNIRGSLAVDFAWICAHADAVALLPDWIESKGARAEAATAVAIGIPALPFESFLVDLSPALN